MNISRLKWQCRRGTKELDLLLTHYLEQHYPQAMIKEQQTFQQLLELTDEELSAYLLGQKLPSQRELANLIEKIRKLID